MKTVFKLILNFVKFVFVSVLTLFLVLQMAGIGYVIYKARPLYVKLQGEHLLLRQKINLQVDSRFPIKTGLDTTIEIPIQKRIAVTLPIKGKLELGIDEPFTIPVTSPIHVYLDHDFRIKKDLEIHTQLTLDQMVQTRTLGFDKMMPIKAEVPVDLTLPFDELITIDEEFSLETMTPLTCQIRHDFNIPIDLTAKTDFLIDQIIPVPVNMDISTGIRLSGELPCYLYIDIYFDESNRLVIDHEIRME